MPEQAVVEIIKEELITASILPGSWLREEAWAKKLGVSRTPLREALVELHREGLLQKHARRGFRCPELNISEVKNLYSVAISIELGALRSSAFRMDGVGDDLQKLNHQLAGSLSEPRRCLELDMRWHEMLVANGENQVATLLHRQIWNRIGRYEFLYWKYVPKRDDSFNEHKRIIEALSENDITLSSAQLESHWRKSTARIQEWLKGKQ